MMSCQEFQAMFNGYLTDALNAEDQKRVESHFAACGSCRQWVEAQDCLIETMDGLPEISVPKSVKQGILQRITRYENNKWHDRLNLHTVKGFQIAGAGIALAMLMLIWTKFPKESVPNPAEPEHYSQEDMLRAQEQLKWSLAYVNQVMTETKKQTVEDVLLNQLPATVRHCVEKTVPFLKGDTP